MKKLLLIIAIILMMPQQGLCLRTISMARSVEGGVLLRALTMPEKSNTIIMSTGGGDCAGLNDVIGHVIMQARERGLNFLGVKEGFKGFAAPDFENFLVSASSDSPEKLMGLPSTDLLSSRDNPFKKGNEAKLTQLIANLAGELITDSGQTVTVEDILNGKLVTSNGNEINMKYVLQESKEHVDLGFLRDVSNQKVLLADTYEAQLHTAKGIITKMKDPFGGIIITGGNDHLTLAWKLHLIGIRPVVAIPKSIDNDFSTQMLGFHTAWKKAREYFWSTAISALTHRRASVVEIMGRPAGWLALFAAAKFPKNFSKLPDALRYSIKRARESIMILVPEKPVSLESIIRRIVEIIEKNKCVNIMVSEGFPISETDPLLPELLRLDKSLAADFEKDADYDDSDNIKLSGIYRYILGLLNHMPQLAEFIDDEGLLIRVEAIKANGYLKSPRPNLPGFALRGLAPDRYDKKLAQILAEEAVALIAKSSSGLTVTLPEGASPFKNKAVALPVGEVIRQKTLTTLNDAELDRQGVFMGYPASGNFPGPQVYALIESAA